MVSEPRKQLMSWIEMDILKMYAVLMEDKMVTGAFGLAILVRLLRILA